MTTMNRHDAIAERLDDYVLGRLTPDEERDVESHLRDCDTCTEAVRELALVMEGLAQAPPPEAPPAHLRQRVLDSIAGMPQEEPVASGARVLPMPDRSRGERRPARTFSWLAAAAVVVLGVGSLFYSVESARRDLAADLRQTRELAASLQQRLDTYAGQTDLALSILTAADMRPIPLAGQQNATDAAARAYWSPTRGLLVVADRMPVPPPGRIYQVWVIADQPFSAGLLGDESTGRGMLVAPPPQGVNAAGTVTVAVTDEPPGGLPAPSGMIRLAGSL
jgi:anti-sigma-K factor RskA